VLYALQGSGYTAGDDINLEKLVETGWWISERLGRESVSRAGRAIRTRMLREKEARAKL
jgi:hydroxymethylglutaryl-CoA lyase